MAYEKKPGEAKLFRNKEKVGNELLDYYRKEVIIFIDIENRSDKQNSGYINLRFIEIKNN